MNPILSKSDNFSHKTVFFSDTISNVNILRFARKLLSIVIVSLVFTGCKGAAVAEGVQSPEQVMVHFLNAFVANDYDVCRSLLAPDATITIVRQDETEAYVHSIQPAAKWLDQVGESGVKNLDSFTVDILETVMLNHKHGTNVVLKFSAKGSAGTYRFESSGFDTGNLVETPHGWRILHYSSFENFENDPS